MEIQIGMTKVGLRKFAQEILDNCDKADAEGSLSVTSVDRYIKANGSGPELVLRLDNEDMERPEVDADESYYELER